MLPHETAWMRGIKSRWMDWLTTDWIINSERNERRNKIRACETGRIASLTNSDSNESTLVRSSFATVVLTNSYFVREQSGLYLEFNVGVIIHFEYSMGVCNKGLVTK